MTLVYSHFAQHIQFGPTTHNLTESVAQRIKINGSVNILMPRNTHARTMVYYLV